MEPYPCDVHDEGHLHEHNFHKAVARLENEGLQLDEYVIKSLLTDEKKLEKTVKHCKMHNIVDLMWNTSSIC